MRTLSIFICLFFAGCVGSNLQHNPVERCESTRVWWQADTAQITSNSPWEKFVRTSRCADPLDPWTNFQEPELFPEDFRARHLDPADRQRIIHSRETY